MSLGEMQMIRERIKKDLQKVIKDSLGVEVADVHLEHPGNAEHGDYSSNVALTLKSQMSKLKSQIHISNVKTANPQELAKLIVKHFPKGDYLERIEVAGAGFINFFLSDRWLQNQIGGILDQCGEYGISSKFKVKNSKLRIQVEFISANPTGPLHVGNARGGFAGDVLANVLARVGYQVQREYYLNDRGGQVEKLAQSVKAYCDAVVQRFPLDNVDVPEGGYAGEYVAEIAGKIHQQPEAERERLGMDLKNIKDFALSEILKSIKETVARMGIKFDQYFSESSLYSSGEAQKAIDFVTAKKLTFEKEGAVWIKTSSLGDDKDRVLLKSNGEMTYIVSDIAYHLNKFEKRKFDRVILFWGADHHGYVPRFQAMIEAIGHKNQATVHLMQLLKLSRGGREVRMSKRTGEYLTVDEVLDEIGLDAARFHFLAVPLNTSMTLDLAKAQEQSQKNPVYYVQYAHARMQSILAKVKSSKLKVQNPIQSSKLSHTQELALIRKLIQFPEVVVDISQNHEVHRLPQYAIEMADAFHRFYENCRVLSEDEELTRARLGLVEATRIILAETLGLLGISAPERM